MEVEHMSNKAEVIYTVITVGKTYIYTCDCMLACMHNCVCVYISLVFIHACIYKHTLHVDNKIDTSMHVLHTYVGIHILRAYHYT